MAQRSRRQELLDEAYADAMLRLRELHEEEFDRLLKAEQQQRGLDVSDKGGSETDDSGKKQASAISWDNIFV